MIQKLVMNLIILALLVVAMTLVVIAPYHIYTLSLTDGVSTRFLTFKAPSKEILNGGEFVLNKEDLIEYEDSSVWKDFHFQHHLLPLPIHHPNYVFLPLFINDNDGTRLGAEFLNMRNVKLAGFKTGVVRKFELSSGKESLFLLPIFKKMLEKVSAQKKWEDLFSKKLSLPSNEGKSFLSTLKTMWDIPYNDLVYNLYILYNRQLFFKDQVKTIKFDKAKNVGVVELYADRPNELIEKFFFFDNGIVYTFELSSLNDNRQSKNLRFKILNNLNIKHSTPDSAVSIYAEYKNISYTQRIDAEGMTYLMSAWSHDMSNKEFLRVMISFLERGKHNIKFLKPLYEFAYKKYGTNLSSNEELIIENANERVKRKAKEELEAEIRKAEEIKTVKQDGEFTTEEEKMKYFLQRAKDKKTNSDTSIKELSSP